MNIPYTINPSLVRGLDYYGHLVFEWVTDQLGSQATICGGGRFDVLIEQLGGKPTPAVGFSIGVERLFLLIERIVGILAPQQSPGLFFVVDGEAACCLALTLARKLRAQFDFPIMVHTGEGSFKSQFKKADKIGARLALILGEDEIRENRIGIKSLRERGEQITIDQADLEEYIKTMM